MKKWEIDIYTSLTWFAGYILKLKPIFDTALACYSHQKRSKLIHLIILLLSRLNLNVQIKMCLKITVFLSSPSYDFGILTNKLLVIIWQTNGNNVFLEYNVTGQTNESQVVAEICRIVFGMNVFALLKEKRANIRAKDIYCLCFSLQKKLDRLRKKTHLFTS